MRALLWIILTRICFALAISSLKKKIKVSIIKFILQDYFFVNLQKPKLDELFLLSNVGFLKTSKGGWFNFPLIPFLEYFR